MCTHSIDQHHLDHFRAIHPSFTALLRWRREERFHPARTALCGSGLVSLHCCMSACCSDAVAETEELQVIPHPATSIWSCAVVSAPTGGSYIASSANDGLIRFFTKSPELAAAGVSREEWEKSIRERQLDKLVRTSESTAASHSPSVGHKSATLSIPICQAWRRLGEKVSIRATPLHLYVGRALTFAQGRRRVRSL